MNPHLHRKTVAVGLAFSAFAFLLIVGASWPFEALSRLAVIAAVLRGALILCVFSMAFGFGPALTYAQRAFLGLAGAAMTMTVQSLLIEHTPYEIWAAILSTAGFLGFFSTLGGPSLWRRIAMMVGDEK